MREMFPTLADVVRETWPMSLRIVLPSPFVEGDIERMQCLCTRLVPAEEMMDFRALSVLQRATLGLDVTVCCAACFQLYAAHDRVRHSEVADALGMAPNVISALAAAERHTSALFGPPNVEATA
jgi:hypothetical protein